MPKIRDFDDLLKHEAAGRRRSPDRLTGAGRESVFLNPIMREENLAMNTRGTTRRGFLRAIGMGAASLALPACAKLRTSQAGAAPATGLSGRKPNIVLIMSDDMGFSDIGCYGSEVRTPTLDGLAANGLRFTQFYNTARCCPTRASLLTGLYPHQAGIGHMMDDKGLPGYKGDLGTNCLTIAEALRPAGYAAYMAGKWHVTRYTKPDGPKHNWPRQRGFDRFFGTIHGAGSFYDPNSLTRDNTQIPPGEDFYYTDAISDNAARCILDHKRTRGDKPFFLYVAYTAAHWPMHAKPEDIARYKGRYDKGWHALRRERYQRMRKMGLLKEQWDLSPHDSGPWDELSDEDKAWHSRRMEVYAAMIDSMDQGIGRIVKALNQTGTFENTLILFLQDNGGCAEEYGSQGPIRPDPSKPAELKAMAHDELQTRMQPTHTRDGRPVRVGHGVMPGPADTYIAYGKEWANASNTPFRMYKHWVHEGGISTPLIAHWPAAIRRRGEFERQPGHLIDVMATCVDLAGAAYPTERNGQAVTPLEGRSLIPAFEGKPIEREAIYWEHEGNRAIRVGRWKLVAKGPTGPWELYDTEADRSELNDLAAKEPDRARQMAAMWQTFAEKALFVPWPWDRGRENENLSKKKRFVLKAGDVLDRSQAPMVAGKSFRIAAAFEPAAADGVVVAQGGSSLGYALYLKGGRLALATRHQGRLTVVSTAEKLPAGRVEAEARLAADGTVTLTVGGKQVAAGKAPGPIPKMPLDGLQVGRDENGAVGEYAAPNALEGSIEKVVIEVGT